MKRKIYETERFYLEEDNNICTTYYIGIKNYNCNIVEGEYGNLETAIEDIEYFEKTIKDIEVLLEKNPVYGY